MTEEEELFEKMYFVSYENVLTLIDRLGPVTRRDEWWSTMGPAELIGRWYAEQIGKR